MEVATQMHSTLMSFDETFKWLHCSQALLKWKPGVAMCGTGAFSCLQIFKIYLYKTDV